MEHLRVAVTGGSGFIGTNLTAGLVSAGHTVLNIDHRPPQDIRSRASWSPTDILDAPRLRKALSDFDPTWVFHLAARTDLDRTCGLDGYAANIRGVQNVVGVLDALSVERIVFASTSLVFTSGQIPLHDQDYRPTTTYGVSKVIGEKLVRAADPPATWFCVRPTSIWGPWFGSPYKNFWRALERGYFVHPAGKRPKKSYGYVENTVAQLIALMDVDPSLVHRRAFLLADYEPIDFHAWALAIVDALNAPRLKHTHQAVLSAAAIVGDGLQKFGWKNPPITSFRLQNIVSDAIYDMSELERLTGSLPWTWQQGVERTAAWLRASG